MTWYYVVENDSILPQTNKSQGEQIVCSENHVSYLSNVWVKKGKLNFVFKLKKMMNNLQWVSG